MSYGSKQNQEWEDIQTKTFRNWLNHILSKRGIKINNPETDLQDGTTLHALLEELSGQVRTASALAFFFFSFFFLFFCFVSFALSLEHSWSSVAQKMGKINSKAVFRIQKVNNVAVVMQFIKDQGIRVENMGPEDIVNGNMKMVLGLIWTLISHYHVQAGDDSKR